MVESERQRVDRVLEEKKTQQRQPKKKAAAPTASEKASSRRKTVMDKVAPTGYQRMMSVLGG